MNIIQVSHSLLGMLIHYIYMHTLSLSVLRSLVPIARIAFSMSVEHDAMGKLKKVLIFVLPRHIV